MLEILENPESQLGLIEATSLALLTILEATTARLGNNGTANSTPCIEGSQTIGPARRDNSRMQRAFRVLEPGVASSLYNHLGALHSPEFALLR